MKTFTTVLFSLIISACCYAQFSFEGSDNHGVVSNFAYHHVEQNWLYASIQNKLLKSRDNGDTWKVIYSAEPNSEIRNTKVLNENKMVFQEYFGYSANNNIVVMDLTDNSVEKRIHPPTEFGSVELSAFDIMSSNTDVVFINLSGTSSKGYGVYTNDAGATWSTVYVNEDQPDRIGITDLAISNTNPEKLVITRESGNVGNNFEGAGLWISEDAGETWEEHLENILLRKVAFNPHNDNEIMAGTALRWNVTWQDQAVYRTKNNGEVWNEIDVEWDEGWGGGSLNYITAISFNPHEEGQIIILGDNEIVSTTDDGLNWINTTYPGGPSANVESYFHATGVTFNPFNNSELFIDNAYYPLKSLDGGISIERYFNPFYAVTGDISIYHDANQTDLYHGVQYGYIHKNMETGEENELGIYPLDVKFQFGAPIVRLKTDKSIPGRVFIYTTASSGIHLKVSDDYGQNQEQIYQTNQYRYFSLTIDPLNRSIIWLNLEDAFGATTLLHIDFSDMSDILTQQISIPEGKLYALETAPDDSSIVFAAIDNKVFISEDKGETWNDVSGNLTNELTANDYILQIKNNPIVEEQYTIATNKGIFTTSNFENWEKLLDKDTFFVEHSTIEEGQIVALAYTETGKLNFDILYSENMGETWELIENDDLNLAETNNSADVIFTEEEIQLYIGTISLGLVGYNIDLSSLSVGSDSSLENIFTIYPNPTQREINLSGNTIPKQITILSPTGSPVAYFENTRHFSLENLGAGIYFIRIQTETGEKEIHKIIKQ